MSDILERRVTVASGAQPQVLLEGVLTRSNAVGAPSQAGRPVAVLCHPQPLTSSMDDGLLVQIARDLAAAGFIALRFNFRGVGQSEGQQSDGRLEPLDVAGAVEFALGEPGANRDKLCLVGHAFGAYVALVYAMHDPRVKTVVAISPPVFRLTPEVGAFDRPKLFITGEHDEVSPRHKLEPLIERLPARGLKIISGARHLMRGYETTASQAVVHYLLRWASTPGV
ncbi:MAG TPA: alpha/beta fold hydrolase [Ktedonobacterales bacterium]